MARAFVVMELLKGETLKRKLAGQPLDTDELLAIGIQVANALDAAHGRGILHRNIRRRAIFVTDAESSEGAGLRFVTAAV